MTSVELPAVQIREGLVLGDIVHVYRKDAERVNAENDALRARATELETDYLDLVSRYERLGLRAMQLEAELTKQQKSYREMSDHSEQLEAQLAQAREDTARLGQEK